MKIEVVDTKHMSKEWRAEVLFEVAGIISGTVYKDNQHFIHTPEDMLEDSHGKENKESKE